MKVCLAYPLYLPYVGGIELYIDELATGLASHGHEVCIFTSKLTDELLKTNLKLRFTDTGGQTESEFKDNIYIRRFQPSRYLPIGRIATNQFLFEYSEALRRFVGKNQFDVINWHTADKCGFSLLTGYNSRSINVLTLHGNCYPIKDKLFLNRLFIKSVLKKADKIICVTEDASKGVARFGIDKSKVYVVSNWVDTAHFSPIQRRTVPDGFKRVLYVGRMVREKGVDLLIEALKELIDAGLKMKGIFVGDGPDLPYFKALAIKLCIGEYLTFVGSIPHRETVQFYSIADVFVLLSVYEGQGRVLLEALSCGVPVIVFKSGGIAEVVNEKVGVLLEERSVKSAKEAIFALLTDSKKLREMRIDARKYIVEKYKADLALSEIEAIYQSDSVLRK